MININKLKPRTIFETTINLVFSIMLLFITLGIIIGVVDLFYTVVDMFLKPGLTAHYLKMISDLLTLFILIELSRSLVEYFNSRRIRLTFIVDAALVFVLREIMIQLFEHKITIEEIYALSLLLLVLGLIRFGTVWAHLLGNKYEQCGQSENK